MRTWMKALSNAEFSPLSLFSGGEYGFFFDFSDTSTLWQNTIATIPADTNGDTILRVDDKSGNGLNLTAVNGPTYTVAGGLSYAQFDGTNDVMTSASFTDDLLDNGGSIFMAVQADTDEDLSWAIAEYEPGSPARRITLTLDTRSTNKVICIYNPADDGSNQTITADSDLSNSTPYVIGFVDNGTTGYGYIDGTQQVSTMPTSDNFVSATRSIVMGKRSDTGAFADIKVFAALAIDRELTAAEITNLSAWLSTRAGI